MQEICTCSDAQWQGLSCRAGGVAIITHREDADGYKVSTGEGAAACPLLEMSEISVRAVGEV